MTKEELLQELLWFARYGESEYALKPDEAIIDEIEDYLDSYIYTMHSDAINSIINNGGNKTDKNKHSAKIPDNIIDTDNNTFAKISIDELNNFITEATEYYSKKLDILNKPRVFIKWPKDDTDIGDEMYYTTWPNFITLDMGAIASLAGNIMRDKEYTEGLLLNLHTTIKYTILTNIIVGIYELNDVDPRTSYNRRSMIFMHNADVHIQQDADHFGLLLNDLKMRTYFATNLITLRNVLFRFINMINPSQNELAIEKLYRGCNDTTIVVYHKNNYDDAKKLVVKIPPYDRRADMDFVEEESELYKFNKFIYDTCVLGTDSTSCGDEFIDKIIGCNFNGSDGGIKFNIILE